MTQVTAPFASPMLRAARAIEDLRRQSKSHQKVFLTAEQKRIARHMSWQEGITTEDIRIALGLDCTTKTMRKHLLDNNIKVLKSRRLERPECGR